MYKKASVLTSAIIWILLPKCSACLMAYMGLFSALGLGHIINNAYTIPVIKVMLAVNLAASLYLAIKSKQYMYAVISFVCACSFIVNKLYFNSMIINIAAGIVLIAAAMRIRLMRINKRKCLFNEGGSEVSGSCL